MKELNTLANKKYELNLGGQNPNKALYDYPHGFYVGDTIVDIGADTTNVEWRCLGNTAGNAYWMPFSESLKSTVGSGLFKGGLLSVNTASGSKTFDISEGSGLISDQSTPEHPIVTRVQWNTKTNVSATFLTSDIRSNVFINNSGGVEQSVGLVTYQNTRDYIVLGRLQHSNKTIINAVNNLPRVIYDIGTETDDLCMALGTINISGNVYFANGANRNINKSSGQSHRVGANYTNSKAVPNITTDNPGTALSFQYRYRDSLGGFRTSTSTTTIDVGHYDTNAGTPTAIPSPGGQKKRWTIQRIYYFPGPSNTYITYGQAYYDSIADVRVAITQESPIIDPLLTAEASMRCFLIVEMTATALNDTANNAFVSTGKIGEVMAGGSAGGDVVGPSSSVDNSLARFDGTTGKLIKDGANIVATDIDNGRIGIGTTSPISQLHSVITTNNVNNVAFISDVYGSGSGAGFICRRARGTHSIPSNVASNDSLGYWASRGYGTTGFASTTRATIIMRAAENWTDASQGTYITIQTTKKGTATPVDRVKINDIGQVIGGRANVANITNTYTVTIEDNYLFANAAGGGFSINLPTAVSNYGQYVTIKKVDSTANGVTIDPYLSETIDGQPTKVINTQYSVTTIVANGSNWMIV